MAQEKGLKGWVCNTTDGVHLEFNASDRDCRSTVKEILENCPPLARVTGYEVEAIGEKLFDNFQIIHKEEEVVNGSLLLSPDFALCKACRAELLQNGDRREAYAFITCTLCGPRYSIIDRLPYDRPHTTMQTYEMCALCAEEYHDPLDRRYYSQTNSCHTCGIQMELYGQGQQLIEDGQERIVDSVVEAWRAGRIVAVKGIGGYLLTCDAANARAIKELRLRKHRPSKPLALMAPGPEYISALAKLHPEAEAALNGSVAPIVLLSLLPEARDKLAVSDIAPSMDRLGFMIPYAPFYEILLRRFGRAVVATSGNISNSPIVFEDKKALNELSEIADLILVNDREIVSPQDDSVLAFSPFYKVPILLRRSRGLAPTYINAGLELPPKGILAAGAMLKSTFTILHEQNLYISQYLGDLEQWDTQKHYRLTLHHLLDLLQAKPELILADTHPDYPSTLYAVQLAKSLEVPCHKIQHHLAHFGAVLGEHLLHKASEPILGVIWDGTGLGTDGHIWGGEYFIYHQGEFRRHAHLEYFDFILGDKMPREPRISALAVCREIPESTKYLKAKFSDTEWKVYKSLLQKESALKTSSMGRLFDSAASLLGIADRQSYEGEAAMYLEALATHYFESNGLDRISPFPLDYSRNIPTTALMAHLIEALDKGEGRPLIAARFHLSLVESIRQVADSLNIKKLAFSGGVFQNGLLVDLIKHRIPHELYFHLELSPNDENIAFGQLMYYLMQPGINQENFQT